MAVLVLPALAGAERLKQSITVLPVDRISRGEPLDQIGRRTHRMKCR
jgi:hypothetical protein